MSDGPHRSLPMRRHWKDTAERAARPVHSSAEVCNALTHALKRDILEAPIEKMRDILNSRKPDLFHIHQLEQLEQLRSTCRGSAAANLSIDCAIEAVQGGLKGQAAVESTLRNALEETMRSAFRGMNDHYQREATPKETHNLRARLDAARHKLDCGAVANELLSPTKPPSPRSLKLLRHTGLDEGPERP
jgi:hypothetical protein